MDRERTGRHVLVASVKDEGSPSAKTSFVRLTVKVTDHNDHAPTFMSELIQTKLFETAAPGTAIVQVTAVSNNFVWINSDMKVGAWSLWSVTLTVRRTNEVLADDPSSLTATIY